MTAAFHAMTAAFPVVAIVWPYPSKLSRNELLRAALHTEVAR